MTLTVPDGAGRGHVVVPGSRDAALAWKFSETRSLAEFRSLQRNNCHFDAWLRFARVPSLANGKATDSAPHVSFSASSQASVGHGMARRHAPGPASA